MGIDFCCGDISFCCSNSDWSNIRIHIIEATFNYVEDKINKDKDLYRNLSEDDENWIGDGSMYQVYMEYLLLLKKNILSKITKNYEHNSNNNTIDILIKCCHNITYINTLNYFEVGGLFVLCNQYDTEGYYTPGNSLDICSLLDRIEPFVKKYSSYDSIYTKEGNTFNSVYEVFEHSYKILCKVTIS